jgi:phenylpropionate dioxygenase-like ring-hydroxylating dioxygenase large terminal subunit
MIADPVLIHDWHVVARATELHDGQPLRVRLLGEDVVIWRHGVQVMAWQDLCIHRGARLSLGKIENGTLECAYHGWTYDTTGQCVKIPAHPNQAPPAKAQVKRYTAVERYGWIWVTFGQPQHDIPVFEEWEDASFRKIFCGPYRFQAAAPRAVENFLDVAHFPFVHEGYLGVRDRPEIPDYEVTTDEHGVTAHDITIFQPNPDGTGVGKPVTYTYRVYRPLTVYFVKHATQQFAIYFSVTPVEQNLCLGWMCMTMNYAHDIPEAEMIAFQDAVATQDVPIVESQRPEKLPLDLQAELHLRSDKTSIAYRKWLNELGLTFGTS